MALTLVTPPAEWPVSLAEAKAWCRVDSTADDAVLSMLVRAACQAAANFTRMAIGAASWRLTLDAFADPIQLPVWPVLSIGAITYTDPAEAVQTVASESWVLDTLTRPAEISLTDDAVWPETLAAAGVVRVDFTAGHTSNTLDDVVRVAILGAVAQWYDDRVPGKLPAGSIDLLRDYRWTEF